MHLPGVEPLALYLPVGSPVARQTQVVVVVMMVVVYC
jgi:hypothetical protein